MFLVVTGGEALYADLGHFGRKPIQTAWLCLVLPALLINYFGQGAKVLADPTAIENPFYRLVPDMFLMPMIVLATAATVIASQAVITGAYSLVHQAIQLGLLPRLTILHTSASHVGQIYIPRVTIALLVGVLLLVGLFRTSSALASAYGIAVATTMVVDGLLAFIVIWKLWQWPLWKAVALITPFVVVDVTFFSANLLKLFEGAWVPILFGATMVLIILTWRRGTGPAHQQDPAHRGAARHAVPQPGEEAAAYRAGHRGVPHQRSGIRAHRAAAQPQAQQGAAREQRDPHHRHRRHAARAGGRPRQDHAAVAAFLARVAEVRLHGTAQRAQGAGDRAQARLAVRHHVDLVLPVAALAQAVADSPACRAGRTTCSSALARSASDATDFFQIPTGRVVEVGTQVAV